MKLIIIRHGQSLGQIQNLILGWTDSPLTLYGKHQIENTADILKENGIIPNVVYMSFLERSIESTNVLLSRAGWECVIKKNWQLNEMHRGVFEGCSKRTISDTYGKDVWLKWRKSKYWKPPPLSKSDQRHPLNNDKYLSIPTSELPNSESYYDCELRFLSFWQRFIQSDLYTKKTIIIVGHGIFFYIANQVLNLRLVDTPNHDMLTHGGFSIVEFH